MRTTGRVTHWNPDKGYGFITPDDGGARVFAHISAFQSRIPPPRLNDEVSYLLGADRDGRPRADRVLRKGESLEAVPQPASRAANRSSSNPSHSPVPPGAGAGTRSRSGEAYTRTTRRKPTRRGSGGSALVVLGLVAVAAFSYYKLRQPEQLPASSANPLSQPLAAPAPAFQCDGRQHCSQMTSCAEAEFFINNCPGTKMDGDRDGIPCESQWCG